MINHKNPYQKPVKIRINQVNFFKHIKKTKWMHHEPIRILPSLQFIWRSYTCNKLTVINSAWPILMCPFGIGTCRWTAIPIRFLVLYTRDIMLSVGWYFGIANNKESLIIYYRYYRYLLSRHFYLRLIKNNLIYCLILWILSIGLCRYWSVFHKKFGIGDTCVCNL